MRTIDDRTGLEVLSQNECLLLMTRTTVGRLAAVEGDRAAVFPVNFRRDGDAVVFRTDEGTKLELVSGGHPVTFEVDEIDPASHTGWSVVVTGRAHEVTDPTELDALAKLPLRPWTPGPKARYVRVVPEQIDGRRIVHLEDAHYGRTPSAPGSQSVGREEHPVATITVEAYEQAEQEAASAEARRGFVLHAAVTAAVSVFLVVLNLTVATGFPWSPFPVAGMVVGLAFHWWFGVHRGTATLQRHQRDVERRAAGT